MKVRFDNPTFIVYTCICFQAVCLSSLAVRTKCFTAWQHKLTCRKTGRATDFETSFNCDVLKYFLGPTVVSYTCEITKITNTRFKVPIHSLSSVTTRETTTDYISQEATREAACWCRQPGTGGVGLPCQSGNYFYCVFCPNDRIVTGSWFGSKWRWVQHFYLPRLLVVSAGLEEAEWLYPINLLELLAKLANIS